MEAPPARDRGALKRAAASIGEISLRARLTRVAAGLLRGQGSEDGLPQVILKKIGDT
jgi:hypothetical protein